MNSIVKEKLKETANKTKQPEQLSEHEWKELMGQFNQTLSRRNGVLRRRG